MNLCVDLFSGLGGFSAAFEDASDWEVFTVDLDPDDRFNPDLTADIMDLSPTDLLAEIPPEPCQSGAGDTFVILASPPCTEFSIAASRYEKIVDGEPQTPEAKDAVALVYHTLGLIKGLNPDYWFLENPRGYLRHIIGEPTGWISYCQYGRDYMKPTELWGEHPRSFEYRQCPPNGGCHVYNTDWAQGGDGNMSTNPAFPNDPAKRAKVPYELSKCILEAVESPSGGQESAAEVEW